MRPPYYSGMGKMTLAMAAVILNWQYVLSLYILWSQGTDTSSSCTSLFGCAGLCSKSDLYTIASFPSSPPNVLLLVVVVESL